MTRTAWHEATGTVPGGMASMASTTTERSGCGTNRFRKANNLFHRLALHVQGDQQRRDLRIRRLPGEDFGHYSACLFATERLAMVGEFMQCFRDHRVETALVPSRTSSALRIFRLHDVFFSCFAHQAHSL